MSEPVRYRDDCERIQRVVLSATGSFVPLHLAEEIWEEHSDTMAAGWMMLDGLSDEEVATRATRAAERLGIIL